MANKRVIGYTAGCYDMFHIGHLNILKRAKEMCDYLIVGVNSDEAMYSYKKRYPMIPQGERLEIVKNLKQVDGVLLIDNTDKRFAYEQTNYDIIFVGDDHKGEEQWTKLEEFLNERGSRVVYLPYTNHTSSTNLRKRLKDEG